MNPTTSTATDAALARSLVARFEDRIALAITDAHRRVLHAGSMLCRTLGCTPAAIIGQPLELLFGQSNRELIAAHDAARNFGTPSGGEWWVTTPDGRTVFSRVTLERFDWPDGAVLVTIEPLHQGRDEVLDLIARGRPLEESLGRLVGSLEAERPGARFALTLEDGRVFHGTHRPGWLDRWRAKTPLDDPNGLIWPSYVELNDAGLSGACWSVPLHSRSGRLLGALLAFEPQEPQPDGLEMRRLESAARLATIALEQTHLGDQVKRQADHDALTGLPNRRLFDRQLRQAIAGARQRGERLAVALIDVSELKLITETLGHAAGEALMKHVAERLSADFHDQTVLARIGSDEFALLMPNISSDDEARARIEGLLERFQLPLEVWQQTLFVTASVGLSFYPEHGHDPTSLRGNAELALRAARQVGGNTVRLFTPDMGDQALGRLRLQAELRHAIERNQLWIAYQPQFDLTSRRLLGFEALLRWNHPEFGPVPPSEFILVAESHGLIFQLWEWMLHQVCAQLVAWEQRGYPNCRVALNVTATQFAWDDFARSVTTALEHYGLNTSCLELELTESCLMSDVEASIRQMERLRRTGVSIALDDFGTGHSSLAYLLRLPIGTIKIDRAFVKALTTPDDTLSSAEEARGLLKAIIGLTGSLGLRTVGEGIETIEQLHVLRELGCDIGQGYLFARPLTAAEAAGFLESGRFD